MSDAIAVAVDCYAGSRGDETSRRVTRGDQRVEMLAVVDQWRTPDHRYFRIRTAAETCTLRQDVTSGGWAPTGLECYIPASLTLTGQLSDSTCRLSHDAMAGPAGLTALEYALVCVEYGSGYVLVTALPSANPDFPGLQELLGQPVQVTGEQMDEAIVLSKIELFEPLHRTSSFCPVAPVPATTLARRVDTLMEARGLMPRPARFGRADLEAA